MKSFRIAVTKLAIGLACCGAVHAQEWLTNGLVAYLPMDGHADDASGNGGNGILSGTFPATNRLGQPSAALLFPGTNGSFVDMGVPISWQFGGDFTLSAWVNFSGGEADARLLSYGGDLGYELVAVGSSSNRQFQFSVAGSSIVSETAYPPNEWHFVAAQLEGTEARLNVDGNCVGTNPLSAVPAFAGNLYLARSEGGNYYGGALDEVRGYHRALSTNELAELFALGPVTSPVITTQPMGGTNYVLTNTTFSVVVAGVAPLSYQWRKNGLELAGQTNATLALNSLVTNDAGGYSVVVTNSYGSATSSVAMLVVKRLTQYITYFQPLPTNAVVGDPPIPLVATSSSGLPVYFDVIFNDSVVEVRDGLLYLKPVGAAYILAQPVFGDAIYAPSSGIYQAFTVGGIPLAITAQPTNQLANVGDVAALNFSAIGTGSVAYRLEKQSTSFITNSTPHPSIHSQTTVVTTSNYPSPPPSSWVQTNASYVTVLESPDPIPYGMVTNTLVTPTASTTYPAPGTFVGTPVKIGSKWQYYKITGTNYTYPSFTFTYPVVTYTTNFVTNTTVTTSPYYTTLQSGLTLSNELNAAFVLTNVQSSDAGNYCLVITNHSGAVTSSVVTLTVNQLPVAMPDVFICKGNSSLIIPISGLLQNDSDPDGDPLTSGYLPGIGLVTDFNGFVSFLGEVLIYRPPANCLGGLDHFDYLITDGRTGYATGSVSVQIIGSPLLSGELRPEGYQVTCSNAVAGASYVLQASSTLDASSSWQNVATNLPVADGPVEFIDASATNFSSRFYRVVMP